MSEKKLKGKQAWCLNTVAILKPYIERKEHITRSTAGKLVKPVTNWQRRELDTLRKQANQIIRGENVSPLIYTVFGMTLEHPEMQPVKEAFDATIKAQREPFTLPNDLKILGLVVSEEDVFSSAGGRVYRASKNDTWLIRHDSTGVMDMLIVEDDKTYVIIYGVHTYPSSGRGHRCIYPECVKVADIEIVPAPPAMGASVNDLIVYSKSDALNKKDKLDGDAYYDDERDLHVWMNNQWTNLGPGISTYPHQNRKLDPAERIDIHAAMAEFGQQQAEELVRKLESGELTKPKRMNPRYTVWVADEYTSSMLDEISRTSFGHGKFTIHDGRTYFRHLNKWCQVPNWYPISQTEPELHHGSVALYDVTPYTSQAPHLKSYACILELEASGALQPGDAYINHADHIIVWMNNEWTDAGKFNHDIGYIRTADGNVYPKSRDDLMVDYLGCPLSPAVYVQDWSELPENPAKGDYCLMHSNAISEMRETVFDGEVWIEMEAPYHPIAIPEYTVWRGTGSESVTGADWKFEEPKPAKNGFWSRLGRVLGFK